MKTLRWRAALGAVALGCLTLTLGACTGDAEETPTAAGTVEATATADPSSTPEPAEATDDASPGVADLPDPCTLASADELQAATGLAWDEGVIEEELSDEDSLACLWSARHPFLAVAVSPGTGTVDTYRDQWKGRLVETDEVVGATRAWLSPAGHTLHMVVNDVYVELEYSWYPEEDPSATVLAIAHVVAGNILGDDAFAASGLPDPCALVSEEELLAATGYEFTEEGLDSDSSNLTRGGCGWTAAEVPTMLFLTVSRGDATADRAYWEDLYIDTADATVAGATDAWTRWEGTFIGMEVGDLYVTIEYDWHPDNFVPARTIADLAEAVAGNLAEATAGDA
ncbi:hypothetical protein [Demequina pelophila]|uniref:hypothetical protein n=1 Tax=Demequina pelophila TaxID=1638984 RepID=UPI000782FFA4|nr:hypothetical protein [Demequina pelophila]